MVTKPSTTNIPYLKRCSFTGRCDSEGIKCSHCKNNPNKKEDHYEPDYSPTPYPMYPGNPDYPAPVTIQI